MAAGIWGMIAARTSHQRRRTRLRINALSIASMLCAIALPAHAQTPRVTLSVALSRLAREAHLELLFDERMLAGKVASPDLKGKDPESRLRAILAGTGLTFRRTATGAYLVVAVAVTQYGAAVPAPREEPVADILVIGRRTLNADIRRGRDDIQRYEVFDQEAVARSQSATLDSFLRSDFVDNRQIRSLGQTPLVSEGAVRSQVDVHGLGADQTLVLVDGRRLPRIVSLGAFLQPDLNGLPLYAVDRIETIGTTAGGIFGIGAAGGAVNVVIKADYDDISAASRFGITDRGDALERGGSLHVGFTSRNGRSRVSARISANRSDGLKFGDRSYVEDALRLTIARDPKANSLPVTNGVNIRGLGSGLTLSPVYGGASLGSSSTFLPLDAPAVASGGAAVLLANSGRRDFELSPDGQGALQTHVTPISTSSVLLNARQDVGHQAVIYADYLRLESRGWTTMPALRTMNTLLFPGQAGNPFNQPIQLTFPTVGSLGASRNRALTERLTLGGVISIGRGWSANADFAAGRATTETEVYGSPVRSSALNVFAGSDALSAQLAAVPVQRLSSRFAANRMRDVNAKVAGSPFSLPAGKVYLTLTGEAREERSSGEFDIDDSTPTSIGSTTVVGAQRERVASIFGELRVPMFSNDGPVPVLRSLELQLAVRRDWYSLTAPVQSPDLMKSGLFGTDVTARGNVTAITTGFRAKPLTGVTIRGSYATGYTPPTAPQITPSGINNYANNYVDPKRGGKQSVSPDRTFELYGGSPGLRPQIARTLSAGIIVEPEFARGLRFSIDYSRLKTSRQIGDYSELTAQYFIDHEERYPGRVIRAPLTAADAAKGYTVGRITLVDASYLTVGRSKLEVVDATVDYSQTTTAGGFHVFVKASWEPTLSRQGDPDLPAYNSVNSINGPLSLRATAGLDWSQGPWSAGLSGQAYGAYRVTSAYQRGSAFEVANQQSNMSAIAQQDGVRVPGQIYFDTYVAWHPSAARLFHRSPGLAVRLGVKNVLDRRPPTVVPVVGQAYTSLGYSYYGDARGRRFVLDFSLGF